MIRAARVCVLNAVVNEALQYWYVTNRFVIRSLTTLLICLPTSLTAFWSAAASTCSTDCSSWNCATASARGICSNAWIVASRFMAGEPLQQAAAPAHT